MEPFRASTTHIARTFRHLSPRLSEVFSSGLLHEHALSLDPIWRQARNFSETFLKRKILGKPPSCCKYNRVTGRGRGTSLFLKPKEHLVYTSLTKVVISWTKPAFHFSAIFIRFGAPYDILRPELSVLRKIKDGGSGGTLI